MAKITPKKTVLFPLRITEEESQFLQTASKKFGTKPSDYVRNLIDQNIASYNIAQTMVNTLSKEEINALLKPYENITEV